MNWFLIEQLPRGCIKLLFGTSLSKPSLDLDVKDTEKERTWQKENLQMIQVLLLVLPKNIKEFPPSWAQLNSGCRHLSRKWQLPQLVHRGLFWKRICFSHQVQAYNNTVTNSNTQASFQFNAQDQSQCQLKLNLAAKGDPSSCRVMVASNDDTSQFINLAIPQNEKWINYWL